MKTNGLIARAVRWLYWRSDAYYGDPTYTGAMETAYEHGQVEAVELPETPPPALPPAPPTETLQLLELLHVTIRGYVFRGEAEEYKYLLEAMSVLHQLVGYTDGMACLSGVPAEYREELRAKSEFHGKNRSLKAHDTSCGGCDVGETLRSELYPKIPTPN